MSVILAPGQQSAAVATFNDPRAERRRMTQARAVRLDRGHDGRLKAWVCQAWDRVRLRKCADIVQNSFGGEARDRVGGADLVFWDFLVGAELVTIHLEQQVGIAVLANSESASNEALVQEIAEHLVRHAELE